MDVWLIYQKDWGSHVCLQLGGFVEKYAGSGVMLHAQSTSNKENRRTEGLNRYLETLKKNPISAPGQHWGASLFWSISINYSHDILKCILVKIHNRRNMVHFLHLATNCKCNELDVYPFVQFLQQTSRGLLKQTKCCQHPLWCRWRGSSWLSPTVTLMAGWF